MAAAAPTGIDAVAHAVRLAELGAGELLVTSMDRDGTRGGYDLALTRAIADAVTIPVIASGGVGTLDDLVAGVTQGGASAVLAASIFHFGQHSIAEARAALRAPAGACRSATDARLTGARPMHGSLTPHVRDARHASKPPSPAGAAPIRPPPMSPACSPRAAPRSRRSSARKRSRR